jgi:hypothetical protein
MCLHSAKLQSQEKIAPKLLNKKTASILAPLILFVKNIFCAIIENRILYIFVADPDDFLPDPDPTFGKSGSGPGSGSDQEGPDPDQQHCFTLME